MSSPISGKNADRFYEVSLSSNKMSSSKDKRAFKLLAKDDPEYSYGIPGEVLQKAPTNNIWNRLKNKIRNVVVLQLSNDSGQKVWIKVNKTILSQNLGIKEKAIEKAAKEGKLNELIGKAFQRKLEKSAHIHNDDKARKILEESIEQLEAEGAKLEKAYDEMPSAENAYKLGIAYGKGFRSRELDFATRLMQMNEHLEFAADKGYNPALIALGNIELEGYLKTRDSLSLDRSINFFKKAADNEDRDDDGTTRVMLGRLLNLSGKSEEALEAFKEAAAVKLNPQAIAGLAKCHRKGYPLDKGYLIEMIERFKQLSKERDAELAKRKNADKCLSELVRLKLISQKEMDKISFPTYQSKASSSEDSEAS